MFRPRTFVFALVLVWACSVQAAKPVFTLTDPTGDDNGDGHLLYPSQGFHKGDLDLVGFSVTNGKDDATFTVEFADKIKQPQRGAADELGTDFTRIARHGFYQFNVDIYIDTDRKPGSGFTRMLPGRLAVIAPDAAWDVCVAAVPRPDVTQRQLASIMADEVEAAQSAGTDARVADTARRTALTLQRQVFFPDRFRVKGRTLRFTVPQSFLGGPAQATWSYVVVVTGADLVNSTDLSAAAGLSQATRDNLGVLPISPGEWTDRFGGGRTGEPLQPPIVDLITPPGVEQTWVLSDFDSRAERPAELPGVVPAGGAPETAAGRQTPRWDDARWRGRVCYEIFVRSFQDSDGDGIGDFQGLISRLDYLNDGDPATTNDLGVEGIWLMPVFASPSYHGYDTTDYYALNPQYGTPDDFQRLLDECHRRGIAVVIDLMINHTSDQHPWFVESSRGPDSPLRDWYVWRDDDPGWTQPWGSGPVWHEKNGAYYYGIFWSGMPDLNFRAHAVREEMEKVAGFWLDKGVDGFRLDAARHLVADGPGEQQNDTPETHAYWHEFSQFIREHHPDALMLAEAWTDPGNIARYYGDAEHLPGGDEFGMTFDFALASGIVAAVNLGDANAVTSVLARLAMNYPQGVLDAPFLTNHDMSRVASQLGADERKEAQAAAVLLTLPGTPFLYYGEELGLQNGPTRDDKDKRTPMPWDATAGGGFTAGRPWHGFAPGRESATVAALTDDPAGLLARYRTLIHLRAANPALRTGDVTVVPLDGEPRGILAYLRQSPEQRVLVVHNLGDAPATVAWQLPVAATRYELLLGDRGVGVPANDAITLPARATGVWQLR